MNPWTIRGIMPDITVFFVFCFFFYQKACLQCWNFIALANDHHVKHRYSLTYGPDEDFRYSCDGLSTIAPTSIQAVHWGLFDVPGKGGNCAQSSQSTTDWSTDETLRGQRNRVSSRNCKRKILFCYFVFLAWNKGDTFWRVQNWCQEIL